jgi:hypothetical protein
LNVGGIVAHVLAYNPPPSSERHIANCPARNLRAVTTWFVRGGT